MKKLTPRAAFIKHATIERLAAYVWDAMQLASSHDPEHELRLDVLERQMERLGAPQYRVVYKGKRKSR